VFNSARFNSCLFNGTPVPRQFSHSMGGDLSIEGGQTVAASYVVAEGGDLAIEGGQTIACQYVVAEGGDTMLEGATTKNILHRGGAVTTSEWDWVRVRKVS